MQRISLLLAAIFVASVVYAVHATPPAPKYKIVSIVEKKTPPAHPAGSVSGTFKLIEAEDGFAPIKIENGQPYVSGGACLVYQDTHHVKTCQTQDDCTSNPPAGPENGVGYCHKASGTCWFKKDSAVTDGPGGFKLDDYCLKSTPAKTLVVDNVNQLPVPKGPPNTTRWRIVTCQGLTDPGCATGDEDVTHHTGWGDVIEP